MRVTGALQGVTVTVALRLHVQVYQLETLYPYLDTVL